MSLLKQFTTKKYLTEEDNSAIPEQNIKDIQSNIVKGAKSSGEWANALELVHKAYEASNVERPNPDMIGGWKQYETLISYAVGQLSKYHGKDGTWRMTSESFDEKHKFNIVYNSPNTDQHNIDVESYSINEIIEYFKPDNGIQETKISDSGSLIIEFWEYGNIKSNVWLEIKKEMS